MSEARQALSRIDWSQFTGPYPILALLLVVAEGGLGVWLATADAAIERIVAGALMVLVLLVVMYVLIRLAAGAPPERATGTVTPAEFPGSVEVVPEEVEQQELESLAPQEMAGPDGAYTIQRAPDGWTTQLLDWREWRAEVVGVRPEVAADAKLFEAFSDEKEILLLESPRRVTITPIPGETLLDGRAFPTGLATDIAPRLTIIPLDRAQPPTFTESPLEHNLLITLGAIAGQGTVTLRSFEVGQTKKGDRRTAIAEFAQQLEHVIVDGTPAEKVSVHILVIGVEGEVRDHVLQVHYPSVEGSPELAADLETLQRLASSFRPLHVASPEQVRQQYEERSAQRLKEFI